MSLMNLLYVENIGCLQALSVLYCRHGLDARSLPIRNKRRSEWQATLRLMFTRIRYFPLCQIVIESRLPGSLTKRLFRLRLEPTRLNP